MPKRVTAVVERGGLKPQQPLGLPEGAEREVEVPGIDPVEVAEQSSEAFAAALLRLREEGSRYSDEWWDDFIAELEANRFQIPERE